MSRTKKKTTWEKIAPTLGFIATLCAILGIIGSIGYKVYIDNRNAEPSPSSSMKKQISQEELQRQARVSNWELYTNEQHGFQVLYPQDIVKNTNEEPLFAKTGICSAKDTQVLTLESKEFNKDSIPSDIMANLVRITVHVQDLPDDTPISLKDWVREHCTAKSWNLNTDHIRSISIQNKESLLLTDQNNPPMQYTQYAFVEHAGTLYIIGQSYAFSEENQHKSINTKILFDDIMQSFTFLD